MLTTIVETLCVNGCTLSLAYKNGKYGKYFKRHIDISVLIFNNIQIKAISLYTQAYEATLRANTLQGHIM